MKQIRISIFILMIVSWTAHAAQNAGFAVGPQYDTTHVYVAPDDFDRFVTSFIATFGGKTSKKAVFQVTPTPSQTVSQLVFTPVATISVFGFKTPIPFPFGGERSGYLVNDFDKAISVARSAGADVIVAPFKGPRSRDAVIQWPGGVNMQIYWHTTAPSYAPLTSIPENRVYISPNRANIFIQRFSSFSRGKVVADMPKAPGAEIGLPSTTYRRVLIESGFGKILVIITDGHIAWPYGHELTGYEVPSLKDTLAKAQAAGAAVLVQPVVASDRTSAMVQFPGGYIAEIHELSKNPPGLENLRRKSG